MNIVSLTLNPSIDQIVAVDRVVADRKLRAQSCRYEPGGGGINVARAVKRLGASCLAVYAGGGAPGNMLERLLAREEVPQRRIPVADETRMNPHVFENDTDRAYRFVMPGPNLTEEELDRIENALRDTARDAEYVVISGSMPPGAPPETYGRFSSAVGEAGGKVVLDTSGEPLRLAVERGAFLVKPNIRELRELLGEPLESDEEIHAALRRLTKDGKVEVVVVSLGRAGGLMASGDTVERVPAPSVPLQSKVGAGDSMVAGLVTSLSKGWSLGKALRLGVAAVTAAVKTAGTELCRGEDAWQLFGDISGKNGREPEGKERK